LKEALECIQGLGGHNTWNNKMEFVKRKMLPKVTEQEHLKALVDAWPDLKTRLAGIAADWLKESQEEDTDKLKAMVQTAEWAGVNVWEVVHTGKPESTAAQKILQKQDEVVQQFAQGQATQEDLDTWKVASQQKGRTSSKSFASVCKAERDEMCPSSTGFGLKSSENCGDKHVNSPCYDQAANSFGCCRKSFNGFGGCTCKLASK